MKLHYLHTGESLRVLVMQREARRVELHVRPLGPENWAMVALMGDPPEQPGRHRCQGPFQDAQAAERALRSMVQTLLVQGFSVERAVHPIWAVQAQRLARAIRDGGNVDVGDFLFDPDAHEPL